MHHHTSDIWLVPNLNLMYFVLSVIMNTMIYIPCWELSLTIELCLHIWNVSFLSVDVWPSWSGHDITMEPITDNGTIHIHHHMAQWWFSLFSRPFTELMVLSHIIGLFILRPKPQQEMFIDADQYALPEKLQF